MKIPLAEVSLSKDRDLVWSPTCLMSLLCGVQGGFRPIVETPPSGARVRWASWGSGGR